MSKKKIEEAKQKAIFIISWNVSFLVSVLSSLRLHLKKKKSLSSSNNLVAGAHTY